MKYYILILSTLVLFAGNAFAAEKPNIVLIFADDLGYGDVGCYGATKVKTPNIDKLAAEGRRFTDAHSASAVCTPSRYALLTGEYPFRANGGSGIWGPLGWYSKLLFPPRPSRSASFSRPKAMQPPVSGSGIWDGATREKTIGACRLAPVRISLGLIITGAFPA